LGSASLQFVFFGLATAIVSNLSRSRAWRSLVLFAATVVFIALIDRNPPSLVPLAGFLLAGYACLLLLGRGFRRLLAFFVVAMIFLYIWLKKYTFLPESGFLHFSYFSLGLSYIFFRVLHVLIETGEGGERKKIGLGAYLLYTLNFTTFISGPIQRYDDFARDQFAEEPIPLDVCVIGLQTERILRGFFKVNVLAMLLYGVREEALIEIGQPQSHSLMFLAALRLAIVYPLFLYANFSGYIDIVIALARLMRVRSPENFDRPFSASSFIDFWSRWHITLSAWLKTYVYNPLLMALMRRASSVAIEPFLVVFSFFVTFFLVGLWHGRTSEFIFFGVLQGGGVAINKLWQLMLARVLGRKGYKALAKNSLYAAFGRGLTYTWFSFTLFWFWSNWIEIEALYRSAGVRGWVGVWFTVWLLATTVLALWEWLRAALLSIRTADGPVLTSRYALTAYASAMGLAVFVLTVLLSQPAPDIVYKAF
jgi:D-alanyl-lipoteichoic acid acyltransferase DltB (MBOAT superfamily)